MVDFHGVINANPNKFLKFTSDLMSCGNQVYICSGSRAKDVLHKLTVLGFKKNVNFTDILSITDRLEKEIPAAEIEYDAFNNIWVEDSIWWPIKGKYCKEYKIDLMIDDSSEYFIYVPSSVIRLHYYKDMKNI